MSLIHRGQLPQEFVLPETAETKMQGSVLGRSRHPRGMQHTTRRMPPALSDRGTRY
ncbi:MAG: hypothetical protein VKJ64_20360 [Leptolyngbyaceae bacterium]|nr:hypothetical protein [Leptolyngbyaceae bacterium]